MKNKLKINSLYNGGGIIHILFLFIYFTIGVFALFVVGIIEHDFLKGIFDSPKYASWCLWAVIIFEGFKGFAIYFHRYVEYYEDFGLTLEKRLKRYLKIGRYCAFIISFVVGVAKVSEYLDSPKFEKVWKQEKQQLLTSYASKKKILIKEKDSLNAIIIDFNKDRDKQLKRNINRLAYMNVADHDEAYIAKKARSIREANKLQNMSYSDLVSIEQKRVEKINNDVYRWDEIVRDSLNLNKKKLLTDYSKTENATIVGVYRLVSELSKKMNWIIDFKFFKYLYTLLIAFLVSALLELAIMNAFNYTSYVFFARLDPKTTDTRVKR